MSYFKDISFLFWDESNREEDEVIMVDAMPQFVILNQGNIVPVAAYTGESDD